MTWEARGSFSTIDLVFMSEYLAEKIEHCKTRPDLNQSSDHIPISTRILLGYEIPTPIKRRAWKLLNMEKLREAEQTAPHTSHPRSREEIDEYTHTIQKFLQRVIAASVPWAKQSAHAKPFWNPECNDATKQSRRLRRIWSATNLREDWIAYMKANDKKQKIQDLRVHLGSLVLEGQTGLYCGRSSGNDLRIRRMAYTERNREKQSRDEQAGGHAKQVLANNNACISGHPDSSIGNRNARDVYRIAFGRITSQSEISPTNRRANETHLVFLQGDRTQVARKSGQEKIAETDPRNAQARMGQKHIDQRHTHRSPNSAPTLDHAYGGTHAHSQCSKDESQRSHESHKSALQNEMADNLESISRSRTLSHRSTARFLNQRKNQNTRQSGKAESALATQICTEKIGLASFLFKRRVPNVTTAACSFGWPQQTAKHVIMHCPLMTRRQELFRRINTNEYRTILETSKILKQVTRWIIEAGVLAQFSLSASLLYKQ